MKSATLSRLDNMFGSMPMLVAGPVRDADIDDAEQQVGTKFVSDYREFLALYGGAMVGSLPILGLRQAEVMGDNLYSVAQVTVRFRSDGWPGTDRWVVVSVDGAGNPIGIDGAGEVWTSDHNSGEMRRVALSFEEFVEQLLAEW